MRHLSPQEISALELHRCTASDWKQISVGEGFNADNLHDVAFIGTCTVGSTSGTVVTDQGIMLPAGIRHARIINSTIGDNCLIEHINGYIYNADILDNCIISNVATIQTSEGTTFGQGNTISVLNEAGDGNVVLFSGLTSQLAALTALPPCLGEHTDDAETTIAIRRQAKEAMRRIVMEEVARTVPKRTLIESSCRIQNTQEITNSWIGSGSEIRGAQRICECTLNGETDNGVFIGTGVIIDGCIITSGSTVSNNAIARNCFVGECSTLTDGFSASDSLFFANSFMANGEACAAFCGPFTVSHHKSTLLIGGMHSFYNAGSATNYSNHAYKMGPIHYGIMEHGAKTASGAHILWPARIGAFSMCMGKIATHPDTSMLPFSYVIGDGTDTYIVPARNLCTVGTYRDIQKWQRRDVRPENGRHSIVDTTWLNARTVAKIIEGKNMLELMRQQQPRAEVCETPDGSLIKRHAIDKGILLYSMAIKMYIAQWLAGGTPATTKYHDLSGAIVSHSSVLGIVEKVVSGDIDSVAALNESIRQATANREQQEQQYAMQVANDIYGWSSMDSDDQRDFIAECRAMHPEWLAKIKADAEKEYSMGDVEEEQLKSFLQKLQ